MKSRFIIKSAAALIALAPLGIAVHGQQGIIVVHAKRFVFNPANITVRVGQTVTLSMISDDVAHSLMIEGLKVNTVIVPDHATAVQIKADTPGDFTGRCGRFCGSGHAEMTFVVHVTR